jgi:prolyl oligopeptidase
MKLMRLALAAILAGACASQAGASGTLAYPPAAKGDVSDNFFGTTVADPYRWMEKLDSPETKAWVAAENTLSRSYFDAIPSRNAIRDRYRKLINYEKFSAPFRAGKRWYYYHNTGLQNQSVLYSGRSPEDRGTVFLDPNKLSADGTVALGETDFTQDGKYLLYTTQAAGSDVTSIHIRNIATGAALSDTFEASRTSGFSWRGDAGFYYGRFPKAGFGTAVSGGRILYHKLGTPQTADTLVFSRPDRPKLFLTPAVTDDNRWLYIYQFDGTSSNGGILYKDLKKAGDSFHEFVAIGDASYTIIGNDGNRWYVQTEKNAPRGRLTWVNAADPKHVLHDILPQRAQRLSSVSLIGNRFYPVYLKDAHSSVEIHDLAGNKLGDIPTPGIGTMSAPSGNRDDTTTFYAYSSYGTPPTVYRYNTKTGASSFYRKTGIAFDASQYVTEEVFAPSKDGTKIPLFITHRKGAPRDGSVPTILYAYGGFDIALLPYFSSSAALWLQMGGTYVVACLRGGNEYGEAWHQAGMLAKKQNVFDDFYGSAQYLIDNKYTSTPKLAASGASNGGLLVGAAVTQRPDLWGATLPDVGVMDMLRFQKFTVGAAWATEYGSSEASEAQFKTIYAYSPYNNIKPGTTYPATLIRTADHDDRVYPSHSFKFAAAMQAAQAGDAPVLVSIETDAGHGAGKPLAKQIGELADTYAFLTKNLSFTPKF